MRKYISLAILLLALPALSAEVSTTYLYFQATELERAGELDEAFLKYQEILKQEPAPTIYLRLADIAVKKEQHAVALKTLEEGRKAFPKDTELAFNTGMYYLNYAESTTGAQVTEYYNGALAAFSAATGLETSERNLAALALTAAEVGKYEQAVEAYYKLIRELGLTDYYYSLGMLKIQAGKKDEGIKDLQAAAEANNIQALAQLAEFALADNNTELAMQYLNNLSDKSPMISMVHIYLGEIYLKKGEIDRAIESYIKGAELTDGEMQLNLLKKAGALAFSEEKYELGLEIYRKAIAESGENDAQMYYPAGYTALILEDNTGAQEIFDAGLARFPDYAYLLKRSAANLIALERPAEAIATIQRVDPVERDLEYYIILSNAHMEAHNPALAVKSLEDGLNDYPVSLDLHLSLAFIYDKQKDFNNCERILKKALEIDPKSAVTLNFLGYLYADYNKKLDEAEKLIDQALEIDPDNYAYLDSKAWVLYRKGNYKEAMTYIQKALSFDNEDEELLEHHEAIKKALKK